MSLIMPNKTTALSRVMVAAGQKVQVLEAESCYSSARLILAGDAVKTLHLGHSNTVSNASFKWTNSGVFGLDDFYASSGLDIQGSCDVWAYNPSGVTVYIEVATVYK